MDCRDLLTTFMLIAGPSGYEKDIAYRLASELRNSTEDIHIDRSGNVIARYGGIDPAAPVIMIYAHLDQLGFIVRRIEADGFIQVDRLGGIPEKVLPGLNIQVMTTDGRAVNGVIGSKSHHAASPEEKTTVDPVTSILLDIGVSSAAEARALGVDIGCPAVYQPHAQNLAGDLVSGTAIDNRGGLAALVVASRELTQKAHASTIYLVGTVWEEFNLRGAMLAARTCKPDIAIGLDVVLAGDTPDLENRYETRLGGGPAVVLYSFHGRGTLNGTIPHAGLVSMAERIAREERIPLQRFASLGILTDSAYLQLEGGGVASIELGFPTRYTHTPVEVANVRDIEQLGRLAAAMAAQIDVGFSLNRY